MPRPIRSLGHNIRPANLDNLRDARTNGTGSTRGNTGVSDTTTSPPADGTGFDGTSSGDPVNGLSGRPSGSITPVDGSSRPIDVRTSRTDVTSAVADDADSVNHPKVYGLQLGPTERGSLEHIVSGFVSREPGNLTVEEAAVYKACVGLNAHFGAHLRVSLRHDSPGFEGDRPPEYIPGFETTTSRPLKTKETFEVAYCGYTRVIAANMLKKRIGRDPNTRELAKNVGVIIKKSGVDATQFIKGLLRGGKPDDIAFASALNRYLR